MNRRVVHVIPFLWSGAGRVVTRLCEDQAARGVEVHIATSGRAGGQSDWPVYRRRLRQAGVTWHRLNTFDRRPESLWLAVDRAAQLVSALAPDVIHAHAGVPVLVATLAAERAGLRTSVVGQMYSWGPGRPSWMNRMDILGFTRADHVVVSAERYQRLLLDGGVRRSRLHYVPWGVELPPLSRDCRRPRPDPRCVGNARGGRQSSIRRTVSAPDGAIRLGFVGRLEPRKDQLSLVETLAHVLKLGVDARLTLVGPDGDSPYADAVRARVSALALTDRIRITGAVRSVWPYLTSMDAFVSLAKDEGQGLAVLEAMSAGVPVLARPAAGLEDFLVDGQNGLWLKGSSVRALGHAIAAALSDPSHLARMAARGRRMVRRRFTWPATLQALERVYGW